MPYCAVLGCEMHSKKTKGKMAIVYHNFPRDLLLQKIWRGKCGTKVTNANKASVCSEHFADDDYERDLMNELLGLPSRKKRFLKRNAIPTLKLPCVNDNEHIEFPLQTKREFRTFYNLQKKIAKDQVSVEKKLQRTKSNLKLRSSNVKDSTKIKKFENDASRINSLDKSFSIEEHNCNHINDVDFSLNKSNTDQKRNTRKNKPVAIRKSLRTSHKKNLSSKMPKRLKLKKGMNIFSEIENTERRIATKFDHKGVNDVLCNNQTPVTKKSLALVSDIREHNLHNETHMYSDCDNLSDCKDSDNSVISIKEVQKLKTELKYLHSENKRLNLTCNKLKSKNTILQKELLYTKQLLSLNENQRSKIIDEMSQIIKTYCKEY